MTNTNSKTNPAFWQALDTLVAQSEIIVDRSKGSAHQCYPDFIYPLDYRYLPDTSSMDGDGIDVWRGSLSSDEVSAVICTVDLMKRNSEIKILIGCTEEEEVLIYKTHNDTDFQKGMLIKRRDTHEIRINK